MTKAQFERLPYTEQLEMIAEVAVTSEMESYDAHKAELKMKAQQAKTKGV